MRFRVHQPKHGIIDAEHLSAPGTDIDASYALPEPSDLRICREDPDVKGRVLLVLIQELLTPSSKKVEMDS